MRIDFDEEKHEYSVNGVKIPSVSEILALLSAERYEGLNPWMLKAAAAKGTAVHEACELTDYGVDLEEDPDIEPYLSAYMAFMWEHEAVWNRIESLVAYYRYLPFVEDQGELPLYCGTIDRYGMVDGNMAVVDLKTYASMSSDSILAASCQTQLYKDALATHEVPIKRYILHLKKDGKYRLIDLDKWDNEHGFNSNECAWSLYNVWSWKNRAKKTVRRGKKHDQA